MKGSILETARCEAKAEQIVFLDTNSQQCFCLKTSIISTQLSSLWLTLWQRRLKTLGFVSIFMKRENKQTSYFYVSNYLNKIKLRLFSNENILYMDYFWKACFWGYGHIGCILEKTYFTPDWYIIVYLVFLSNVTAVQGGTCVIYFIN